MPELTYDILAKMHRERLLAKMQSERSPAYSDWPEKPPALTPETAAKPASLGFLCGPFLEIVGSAVNARLAPIEARLRNLEGR